MNRKRKAAPRPTATELSILRILWDQDACTVREVHEAMNEIEPSGYTTALKMLQVMHQKGLVERDDSQRAHVYRAAVSKDQTQSQFLNDIVHRLFDGSTSQLVLQALGNGGQPDQEELADIRRMIDDLAEK